MTHMCPRGSECARKECAKCGAEKRSCAFSPSGAPDGLNSQCRECRSAAKRKKRAAAKAQADNVIVEPAVVPSMHVWIPPLSAELEMECAVCGDYLGMAADFFDPAEVRCAQCDQATTNELRGAA